MIGIVDWGIGGLGLHVELKRERPDLPLLYFSDAGHTPYGSLPTSQLVPRLTDVVGFVREKGASSIVLACNAASTVLNRLRSRVDLPVTGIIESGIRAVVDSGIRSVAVIGGERTIRSGLYRRYLRAEGLEVIGRVAQPLSGMIERGETRGEEFRECLERIVAPLARAEGLLLACTHYPAAGALFRKALPDCQIIDPVPTLAKEILAGIDNGQEGTDRFFTTGDVRSMKKGAKNAFGVEIGKVERVRSL